MRFLAIFLGTASALFLPLASAHAADVYAESLVTASSNVLTPSSAVGAPDGAYADYRTGDAYLTLDMGEDVTGSLSMTVYLIQYGARYLVTFYDANWDVVTTSGDTIPLSTTLVTAPNDVGAYRYVKVTSVDAEQWRLDGVMATGADAEVPAEETDTEETTDETTEEETPAPSYTAGTLLKTDDSAAVYILGGDGYRHAFPTEREFTSWGLSFDDVEAVDASTLAAYSLGANVTIRPGTHLVKLQTNPKVFAVEPGGVLRWVASESVALQLYGAGWASRVVDVSDAFWGNYTVGEDITATVHPDGSVLTRAGVWYYVADATKATLDDDTIALLRLSEDFVVSANASILDQYIDGTVVSLTEGAQWPY